jgi:hypothetical protein
MRIEYLSTTLQGHSSQSPPQHTIIDCKRQPHEMPALSANGYAAIPMPLLGSREASLRNDYIFVIRRMRKAETGRGHPCKLSRAFGRQRRGIAGRVHSCNPSGPLEGLRRHPSASPSLADEEEFANSIPTDSRGACIIPLNPKAICFMAP